MQTFLFMAGFFLVFWNALTLWDYWYDTKPMIEEMFRHHRLVNGWTPHITIDPDGSVRDLREGDIPSIKPPPPPSTEAVIPESLLEIFEPARNASISPKFDRTEAYEEARLLPPPHSKILLLPHPRVFSRVAAEAEVIDDSVDIIEELARGHLNNGEIRPISCVGPEAAV